MEKYASYIREIDIPSLWGGRKHINWTLDPEVNVLSGINGVGKSTILNRIACGVKSVRYNPDGIIIKTEPEDADVIRFDIITTPDVRSEYDINLQTLMESFSHLNHDETSVTQLYDIIDQLFEGSHKTISRDGTFHLIQYGESLDTHLLSSGEKQMLCILLTVYLEGKRPTVLFMDEPEVSLHIEWQQKLISIIRQINPHVQIILTTHSPAMIMEGWMDKVVDVEDITVAEP